MNGPPDRIVLVDLRIPFIRLVMFFIKAGLAAIPAAIVVGLVVMLISAFVVAILGGSPTFFLRRWSL